MAELEKQDIFIGSRVDVSFTLNTDSETAGFYDPGYVVIPELAAFPQVTVNTNMQELEVFDQDYSARLSGDKQIEATTIVVNEIPADPIQQTLIQAADDKTLVRFRNFYVIDTGESTTNSQQGMYQIFDAYVSGYSRSGSNSSVAQIQYNLQPTGQILAQGVAETGELLRQGDYGVGAGVAGFPGPKDTVSLLGNSWRTYLSSVSDNPYTNDTTIIHSQPNESSAWQITGNTRNTPSLYVRNLQADGENNVTKSKWIKVITEANLPKPEDINAVSKTGDTMTGDLKIQKVDAMISLNTATVKGTSAGQLVLASNKQPITLRPNGDLSTTGQVQIATDGVVTAPNFMISAAQSNVVGAATRKDYVDGEIAKQVSKSGDTMTGNLSLPKLIAQVLKTTGVGDTFSPDTAGAYTIYGYKGSTATDFITHKGTGTGGFNFYNGNETLLEKIAGISGTGYLTVNGFESVGNSKVTGDLEITGELKYNGQGLDGRFVKKSGDTMTGQLVAAGVRVTNGTSYEAQTTGGANVKVLNIGADNKVTVGATNVDTVIQSRINPAVKVGNNDYVMYHTGNIPTAAAVGAIPVGVAIDFGTF